MRHDRRFWQRVVAVAETSERSHAEVAAQHRVRVATLRSWIYRLRREREQGEGDTPRLLPVRVAATPPRETIAVEVEGLTLHVPAGCDPEYVASLLRAVRAC